MIDYNKYNISEDDFEFLEYIKAAVGVDSQCEVFLKYKDFFFMFEPHGEEVEIFSGDKSLGKYKNIEDLFLNFMVDGKSFIERIKDIYYE